MFSLINNFLHCPILKIFTLAQVTHDHGTRLRRKKLKIKKYIVAAPIIWNSISHTLYYKSDLTHLLSTKTFSSLLNRAVFQEHSN